MNSLDQTEHRVINITIINDGLFELTVERNGIYFDPGDCVAIYLLNNKSRPYSISSGINDNTLSFLIREIKNGEVSAHLKLLRPGDILKISQPFGWFKPAQYKNNIKKIFFATGTGIAPFLSYIKTFPYDSPYALFYGVRKKQDAIGFDLFKSKKKYLTVSREASKYHRGRITDLFSEIPISKNINYYCCGREKMIAEISLFLIKNSIPKTNIYSEVFWHG